MGLQGTLLNTATFSEMSDLIRKTFVPLQKMVEPAARQLFIFDSVGKNQGNTKRYDEIDTETYAKIKREGQNVKKASVGIGYNKTMTKKRIGTSIDITQEQRDENRVPEVNALITNLAHFVPQRQELDLTHRLSFISSTSMTDMDGDSVSLTGGDGLAIASTAHTLVFSSLTWSNRVSGDPLFSRGGLEAAELLTTTDILSNFGEKRVMNFNTIITGNDPNTVNSVRQFFGSTSDVDQNNSGVMNVYKSKYKHVILPQLATTATGANDSTKRRWWFLAATGQGVMGWQAYFGEWEAAHPADVDQDKQADVWTYGTRGGYGICVVTGRGIIASLPSS
jgi:hypothetical protein